MHCSSVTAASLHRQPGQQHLCIGSQALRFSHSGIFASAARPCGSVTVALLASKSFPIALRHGALASNKPHPAEKSTPVWLPIWCTWAGVANSQLRCATFHSTYSYKCTSSVLPPCNRCSDIANLSAHLHRLPTPPPYLRRMRLSPGRWRRFLIGDMAAVWLGCCSSNSPRARILVLGTSGAHWPARWPQFELTERVAKS